MGDPPLLSGSWRVSTKQPFMPCLACELQDRRTDCLAPVRLSVERHSMRIGSGNLQASLRPSVAKWLANTAAYLDQLAAVT